MCIRDRHNGHDPTSVDHMGIMLNGNSSDHHLWAEIPEIEDNMWHEVEVEIQGSRVSVSIDSSEVAAGVVPELTFKGGFIGFSGTTGGHTNYHRFDNLAVEPICVFE